MRQAGTATGLRGAIDAWRRRFSGGVATQRDRLGGAVVDADLLRGLDRLSLTLGRDLVHGLMGEHASVRRTAGIEFTDYRQYSAGDDLRRIDWNAYARLGSLHVREAQAEHETVLYMLVDGSPSMEFGQPSKFLVARRLAASFGYIALAHLDAVSLVVPGSAITEGTEDAAVPAAFRGRAESGALFRSLQNRRTQSVAEFDNLLTDWASRREQGRVALVLSDLLLDGYREGVRQLLASGFQVTVLHVLTPEELHPTTTGDLELVDSETGAKMEVFVGQASLAEYHRHLTSWLDDSEAWCRTQGAGYMLVRTDSTVEQVMLQMLKRGQVKA